MSQEDPIARQAAEALWLAAALARPALAQGTDQPSAEALHRLREVAGRRWGHADDDGDSAADAPRQRSVRRELAEASALVLGDPARVDAEDSLETGLASGQELLSALEVLAGEDAGLRHLLEGEFRMLDVGTGVAGVASAVARARPGARVHGIDVDGTVLALARHVVASRGCADRVELEEGNVVDLEPEQGYGLVWLSLPMLAQDEAAGALRAVAGSLHPGGRVVIAALADPSPGETSDDILTLARDWRLSARGRCRWTAAQALAAVGAAGLRPYARLDQDGAGATLLSVGPDPQT